MSYCTHTTIRLYNLTPEIEEKIKKYAFSKAIWIKKVPDLNSRKTVLLNLIFRRMSSFKF